MRQIGTLITKLPAWSQINSDSGLSKFVEKLLRKEYTAQLALQDMPGSKELQAYSSVHQYGLQATAEELLIY